MRWLFAGAETDCRMKTRLPRTLERSSTAVSPSENWRRFASARLILSRPAMRRARAGLAPPASRTMSSKFASRCMGESVGFGFASGLGRGEGRGGS